MPGPVPNRTTDLSRERDANRGGRPPITKGELRPVVDVLAPDEEWHPIAKHLYLSLAASGQSDFYQESDWALAWSLCEDLSYYKAMGKRSGQMLQTIYSAMERLLVTEADRRRVRIELTEPENEEQDAAIMKLADYQEGLGVSINDDHEESGS